MIVVDFETLPIEPRPQFPPVPVGVALQRMGGGRGSYLSWGHPSGNNTTRAEAVRKLREFWRGEEELLFHNAPFDIAVAEERLGLRQPAWHRIHDTLPLLFLDDPRAPIQQSFHPDSSHRQGDQVLPPSTLEREDSKDEQVRDSAPLPGGEPRIRQRAPEIRRNLRTLTCGTVAYR